MVNCTKHVEVVDKIKISNKLKAHINKLSLKSHDTSSVIRKKHEFVKNFFYIIFQKYLLKFNLIPLIYQLCYKNKIYSKRH